MSRIDNIKPIKFAVLSGMSKFSKLQMRRKIRILTYKVKVSNPQEKDINDHYNVYSIVYKEPQRNFSSELIRHGNNTRTFYTTSTIWPSKLTSELELHQRCLKNKNKNLIRPHFYSHFFHKSCVVNYSLGHPVVLSVCHNLNALREIKLAMHSSSLI